MKTKQAHTLEILLNKTRVGYLSHYHDEKNIFVFDQDYLAQDEKKPRLSLSFKNRYTSQSSMIQLPPFFSNLLPEGSLREFISQQLGIHTNHEFTMLQALGSDLPGAVIVRPAEKTLDHATVVKQKVALPLDNSTLEKRLKFSLAGVQIKFSMLKTDGHFTLSSPGAIGDHIVKTPSVIHRSLPENEYSMMQLAACVGIEVPETQLIKLAQIERLPNINLPNETYAYVVKRFDRSMGKRIHIEDFAQALGLRSHKKYGGTNYDTMARLILLNFPNSYKHIAQFTKRLLFNILIGNSDAHIKNWSILYQDTRTPSLAPAYDLVSTLPYINNYEAGLNMARVKNFYEISLETFKYFARRVDVPEPVVMSAIHEVMAAVRSEWPKLFSELPLITIHKKAINSHKKLLNPEFQW